MITQVYRAFAGLILIVAILINVDVAYGQKITPPKIPHEKYTLPNGLTVILHEDHSTPIVAINVWYHVGSKNETARAHRFRASFRAYDVSGLEEP